MGWRAGMGARAGARCLLRRRVSSVSRSCEVVLGQLSLRPREREKTRQEGKEMRETNRRIRMIQKVFHRITLFVHRLREHFREPGDGSEIMLLKGGEFPKRRVEGTGLGRERFGGREGVCRGGRSTGWYRKRLRKRKGGKGNEGKRERRKGTNRSTSRSRLPPSTDGSKACKTGDA
jgi:hypothetical protein